MNIRLIILVVVIDAPLEIDERMNETSTIIEEIF